MTFESDAHAGHILARGQATGETLEIEALQPVTGEPVIVPEQLELTLIDAVLAACELSEDETEVADLVDAMVRRDDVRVVPEASAPPWAQPLDGIRHRAA